MKRLTNGVVAALLVLLAASVASAQNPCTTDVTLVVSAPKNFYIQVPDMGDVGIDGRPRYIGFESGYAVPGAVAPQQTIVNAIKADWTLVPGTADCYRNTPATLPSFPIGTKFVVLNRAIGQDGQMSPWGAVSNPFGRDRELTPPAASRVAAAP